MAAPALAGWAVRLWCERLRRPEPEPDLAAALRGLLHAAGPKLALRHAADIFRRCGVSWRQRLCELLREARLDATATLAFVRVVMMDWALTDASSEPSQAEMLEAILVGADLSAGSAQEIPKEASTIVEMQNAVRAYDILTLLSAEGRAGASQLLALLKDDMSSSLTTTKTSAYAAGANLGTNSTGMTGSLLPNLEPSTKSGVDRILMAIEVSRECEKSASNMKSGQMTCMPYMGCISHPALKDNISYASCANRICAMAWHWPAECAPSFAVGTTMPPCEKSITCLLQRIFPSSMEAAPACVRCASFALAEWIYAHRASAMSLVRAALAHATAAVPAQPAIGNLVAATLVLLASSAYSPAECRAPARNSSPAATQASIQGTGCSAQAAVSNTAAAHQYMGDSWNSNASEALKDASATHSELRKDIPNPEVERTPEAALTAQHAQPVPLGQLLESVAVLELSGLLDSLRPFRLPKCRTAILRQGTMPGGGSAEALRVRQWEGGAHAVVDTLLRGASRAGESSAILNVMRKAMEAGNVSRFALEAYCAAQLRRHLRPAPWSTTTALPLFFSDSCSSTTREPQLLTDICLAMPRARMLAILAECSLPMVDGLHKCYSHFHQALPQLRLRLARIEALLHPAEENSFLAAFLDYHKQCSASAATSSSSWSDVICHAALDLAAWLMDRQNSFRVVTEKLHHDEGSKCTSRNRGSTKVAAWEYAVWLEALLHDAREPGVVADFLRTIRSRLRSGWESDCVVLCQFEAARRILQSTDVAFMGRFGTPSVDNNPLGPIEENAKACALFLAEVVASGMCTASRCGSIPGFEALLHHVSYELTLRNIEEKPLQGPLEVSVDVTEASNGGVALRRTLLDSLLAMQRKGEGHLLSALTAQTGGVTGAVAFDDYLHCQLPGELMRWVSQPCKNEMSAGRGTEEMPWVERRREAALLLATLRCAEAQRTRDLARSLLLPPPAPIGDSSLEAAGPVSSTSPRSRRTPRALRAVSEVEGSEECWEVGGSDCHIAGISVRSAAEARSALLLAAAVRRYFLGGRPVDPLPDVRFVGEWLVGRAAFSLSDEERSVAAELIECFHTWLPSDVLETGCRSALLFSAQHTCDEEASAREGLSRPFLPDGSPRVATASAVVRLLSLVHSLPRVQTCCRPIDWRHVFDESVCRLVWIQDSSIFSDGGLRRQLPTAVVQWALPRLAFITYAPDTEDTGKEHAKHSLLGQRVVWLLRRPSARVDDNSQWWRQLLGGEGEMQCSEVGPPSLERWVEWELNSSEADSLTAPHHLYLWEVITADSAIHRPALASTLFVYIVRALSRGQLYNAAVAMLLSACAVVGDSPCECTQEASPLPTSKSTSWPSPPLSPDAAKVVQASRRAKDAAMIDRGLNCAGRSWLLLAILELAGEKPNCKGSILNNNSEASHGQLKAMADALGLCLTVLPTRSLLWAFDNPGRFSSSPEGLVSMVLGSKLCQFPVVLTPLLRALVELHAQSLQSIAVASRKELIASPALAAVREATLLHPHLQSAIKGCASSLNFLLPTFLKGPMIDFIDQYGQAAKSDCLPVLPDGIEDTKVPPESVSPCKRTRKETLDASSSPLLQGVRKKHQSDQGASFDNV